MDAMSVCLWFDDKAEEAVDFYVSLFADAEVIETALYPEGAPGAAGTVMTIRFRLNGADYIALNGGPVYTFTPAVSLVVTCDTQAEVDRLWAALTDGGEEVQCGWLVDRFGVSWQVIPAGADELFASPDREAAARAFAAMMPMKKLDLAELQRAFNGK